MVKDSRGSLYELVPGGTANELISGAIGNIYASKATSKHVPRAGHYHQKLEESFFTLSGTVFWYFEDFRKNSMTFGRKHGIVVGERRKAEGIDLPTYSIEDGVLQVRVPPGVYHVYYPLTDEPALVVAVSSRPYAPSDYFDPIPDKESALTKVLKTGTIE